MRIIAGIDEAGYGPKFGPLTAGRCVLAVADASCGGDGPVDWWALLRDAVGRDRRDLAKRLAVADSKKLTVSGRHGHAAVPALERAVLAFLSLHREAFVLPASVDELLETLGSIHHRRDDLPVWYGPEEAEPAGWDALPVATVEVAGRNGHDATGLALDAGLLRRAARQAGVMVPVSGVGEAGGPCLGVAVLCEDAYNRRLAQASSKADVSFALIAHHLQHVWEHHGMSHPVVVVDRQGGRTRYSATLARALPGASVRIVEEHAEASAYELEDVASGRRMAVRFAVKADDEHLPVALASMTAKYVRELYMQRFQRWFAKRLPEVKPTAGYGTDANRFRAAVWPHLGRLGIAAEGWLRRA